MRRLYIYVFQIDGLSRKNKNHAEHILIYPTQHNRNILITIRRTVVFHPILL
ncbi:hypothetical protein D1AOALGA4SA_10164 [Olavius algarvensis Delta 1 endosymbiont]|nr:hypothetical protein D1AOALGA4SA_10164 [Olavius algarvensis Delta 1 endosymbiont]